MFGEAVSALSIQSLPETSTAMDAVPFVSEEEREAEKKDGDNTRKGWANILP